MAKKNIKAVMDELTAMAQDKNTAPRAFADSFQAHFAELRRRVLSRYANEDAGNS